MRFNVFSVLLILLACSEPSQSQSVETPSTETHAGEASAADPSTEHPEAPNPPSNDPPNVPADPCAELRAETNAILQEPAAACSTDDDCACYPAFIDCGGVSDQATAQRLSEVDERRRAAGCDYINLEGHAFNCAPWECVPRCNHAVCAPGSR